MRSRAIIDLVRYASSCGITISRLFGIIAVTEKRNRTGGDNRHPSLRAAPMRGRYPRHCRNQRSERFGDESFIRQGPILIQVGATESTPICTKNVQTTVRHQPIARLTRKRPQSTSLPWRCQARGSGRTHTRRPPSGPAGPLLRQHASTCRRPSRATCTPHPCVPAQRGPSRASPTLTSRRTRRGRLRWRTPSRMAPDTPEWSGLQAAQTRHRTAKPGKPPQRRATAGSNRGGSNPCTPGATNSLAA